MSTPVRPSPALQWIARAPGSWGGDGEGARVGGREAGGAAGRPMGGSAHAGRGRGARGRALGARAPWAFRLRAGVGPDPQAGNQPISPPIPLRAARRLCDVEEPQQQLHRRAAAVGEVELVVAQPRVGEAAPVVHLRGAGGGGAWGWARGGRPRGGGPPPSKPRRPDEPNGARPGLRLPLSLRPPLPLPGSPPAAPRKAAAAARASAPRRAFLLSRTTAVTRRRR
jgi:hypothetical protein